MAIDSIGGVSQDPTATLKNAGLGQEDFLKILLTQLSFQDPLKPMDNQEFIAQMAQFTSLELNHQSNDKTDVLLGMQAANQAISLLGRTVNYGPGGDSSGRVIGVEFKNGSPLLTISSNNITVQDVSPSSVSTVTTVE